MKTIVLTTQKGGCGKSTLAACLAVAAQAEGERVSLLDLDPKHSLSRWASRRGDTSLVARGVSRAKLPQTLRQLAERNESLAIIDTPMLESPATIAAIEVGDLSLIPARPAAFDVWASEVTSRKLRLIGKNFFFIINQVPHTLTGRVQDSILALGSSGPVLRPFVRERPAFAEVGRSGRGVTEISPRGGAAREIVDLWRNIKRELD
ncbi:MAG TPA: AAA family ATPase [Methylocella sp.]|nr:AAA family ATPase [Methylocella sp.]